MEMNYSEAGVNIDEGDSIAKEIWKLARMTLGEGVVKMPGGFGGLFSLPKAGFSKPTLVSSIDGVGTKILVAHMMKRFDTVGEDLVNHCVNDILTMGARPLFFLDYIGVGRVEPGLILEIVSGISRACRECECALIAGETAEMPSIYGEKAFDLVGTIVGIADRDRIINGSRIAPGDVLLGLPSSGLHTNGYSLARKIAFEKKRLPAETFIEELDATIGEELLRVHRCYLKPVSALLAHVDVLGMAHITGGGIAGNLRRVLPRNVTAMVDTDRWDIPPIFRWLMNQGPVSIGEMFRVFNMGIGMILVIGADAAARAREIIEAEGSAVMEIGSIRRGTGDVCLVPAEGSH